MWFVERINRAIQDRNPSTPYPFGEDEYLDGVNITPDEIYAWSDANKTTPKTSAVGLKEAEELFRKYLDQEMELVVFSISEDMSTTANVMRLAVEDLNAGRQL